MGLAQSLPWIPKIPWPGGGGGGPQAPRRRAARAAAARSSPGRGRRRRARARRAARRSPSRPPPTSSDHDQAELDTLLDKISANGMDGLSADEKRRLNELSKRLRNRK